MHTSFCSGCKEDRRDGLNIPPRYWCQDGGCYEGKVLNVVEDSGTRSYELLDVDDNEPVPDLVPYYHVFSLGLSVSEAPTFKTSHLFVDLDADSRDRTYAAVASLLMSHEAVIHGGFAAWLCRRRHGLCILDRHHQRGN